jgi:acetoin utilization deacetylase AcuC-like enzyme
MTARLAVLVNREQADHRSPEHPERPERVEAILESLQQSDLALEPEQAQPAPEDLIAQVHDARYIALLDRAAAEGGGYLDPDTYMTSGSMAAARTAAGALVEGVTRTVAGRVEHAVAIVRPPGHHAERVRAMGFCLFNNVAVGVAAARRHGLRRLAIVDFDVHHGNGTQHTFRGDSDILYISTHQYPFYPGTGGPAEQGDTLLNIPLPAGTGDGPFLEAYARQAGPRIADFRPELLLVSAGFDAHHADPLAGLEVSTDGYRRLAELIRSWADQHTGGRTVWTLEGGYDLDALSQSVLACLHVLAR